MARVPRSLPEGSNDGEEWQEMLESIDASEVPIELLKYLKAHMKNGTSFVFPIKEWIDSGASVDEIDLAVMNWYKLKKEEIVGSDFIVNLEKVQDAVLTQTNQTLKNLK